MVIQSLGFSLCVWGLGVSPVFLAGLLTLAAFGNHLTLFRLFPAALMRRGLVDATSSREVNCSWCAGKGPLTELGWVTMSQCTIFLSNYAFWWLVFILWWLIITYFIFCWHGCVIKLWPDVYFYWESLRIKNQLIHVICQHLLANSMNCNNLLAKSLHWAMVLHNCHKVR